MKYNSCIGVASELAHSFASCPLTNGRRYYRGREQLFKNGIIYIMKKSLIAAFPIAATTAFIAGMSVVPNTFAASPDSIANSIELSECLTGGSTKIYTLQEGVAITTTSVISISSGDITLDLNGGSITRTGTSGNTVIAAQNGGNLTVKDSVGGGKIVRANDYKDTGDGPSRLSSLVPIAL